MNNTQRMLLAVYLPFTLLLLIFDHVFPGADVVQYVKYTVMLTMFLSVVCIRKKYREQKTMAAAFFFMVVGDFFLVFSTTLHLETNLAPLGMAGFLLAYLLLISACQKEFRLHKAELLTALLLALLFGGVLSLLKPYIHGLMFIGTLVFGLVLCYMTWTLISTVYRGYFSRKTAVILALSGSLMFICDLGVAVSMFYPAYAGTFVPWLKNIIWAAYVPGWTFLAVAVSEIQRFRRF